MDIFPTKGNLMLARSTLRMSRQGFELLDKKRNILVREMMELIGKAKEIQDKIDTTFSDAYAALQDANTTLGISMVEQISYAVPEEDSINVLFRSVMGVEIPAVEATEYRSGPACSFYGTNSTLDSAYYNFGNAKKLILKLAEIENSVYRLADAIRRTQKRANALKNITIPRYEMIVTTIASALEEKDREEFTRLKVIKRQLESAE